VTTRRREDALLVFASKHGDVQCLRSELLLKARRVAGGLAAIGIGRSDVVAVQLPSSIEVVVAHAACSFVGATLLPITHIYGRHELQFVLRESAAKVLISAASSKSGPLREQLAAMTGLEALKRHIVVGDDDTADWKSLCGSRLLPDITSHGPQDIAALIYTSGTTSDPKGVQQSHAGIIAELVLGIGEFVGPESMMLCPWPPGHIAGYLMLARFWALGFQTILMEQWDGAAAARLVEQYQVVLTQGTPYHLTGMLDAAERDQRDLSSIREYVAGATTIAPALLARSEAAGIGAMRSFGMTELPTATRGSRNDPLEKRIYTDGKPCPGVEVRIVDDMDVDVPQGTAGEILLRGPEQFVGYRRPELDRDVILPGGWLRTGDIGVIDAEGYVSITDRKKDIIIRGGENISSREVEELIGVLPGVREVAVVGLPDERLGERVCACVALYEGATLGIEDIDRAFRDKGVARQKTPEQLVVVNDFPRTPSGKIKKHELRRELRTQQTGA
jgi:acyl-CoA synthetase (AMP-forming)/AMP-acid ligase II